MAEMQVSRRGILFVAGSLVLLVLVLASPLLAHTPTYPFAVVNGNSMYPTLHNGDLVVFQGHSGAITNGTIIIFVQGQTGSSVLDSLLKPILIHRIVGIGHEPNGMIDYQTKGDNNQVDDPFVTDGDHVLGTKVAVVPYGGTPIQFIENPYGLLVVTAVVSLAFFSGVDTKFEAEQGKKRLVGLFLRHAVNGHITVRQFEELRLAVEYYEELPPDILEHPATAAMIRWLRNGGLEEPWVEVDKPCAECGEAAFTIPGKRVLCVTSHATHRGGLLRAGKDMVVDVPGSRATPPPKPAPRR